MQQPENLLANTHLCRFISDNGSLQIGDGSCVFPPFQSFCSSNSFYHSFQSEGSTVTDSASQDKALNALKNHKEAEKRRRERINSHLAKLRTLLQCSSKTDKASLLAMVVKRVKELKQMIRENPTLEAQLPSETDEITVRSGEISGDGKAMFMASLCCEDRMDLLADLIEMLSALRLKTVRAEMVRSGGRIRNVLLVSADEDTVDSALCLQNALKSMVERSCKERSKRRRADDR